MSSQFRERFKTVTLVQLMDVIVNSQNYNPEALKAAEEELISRSLSREEVTEAKRIVIERTENDLKREQKIQKISTEYTGILDPRAEKTPDQLLKLVCGGIVVLVLYRIYTSVELFTFMFRYSDFANPVLYFRLIGIGLHIAIVTLLWNRIKAAYYIFYGWVILSLAGTLINLYSLWTVFDVIETFLEFNPHVINLFIYGLMFWIANNKKFKKAFGKKPKEEEIEEMIETIKRD
jgi:hypothetical protein